MSMIKRLLDDVIDFYEMDAQEIDDMLESPVLTQIWVDRYLKERQELSDGRVQVTGVTV